MRSEQSESSEWRGEGASEEELAPPPNPCSLRCKSPAARIELWKTAVYWTLVLYEKQRSVGVLE